MPLEREVDEPETTDLADTILMRRLQSAQPCRLLVVDDDDLVRTRLANLLRASQFEVEVAASGDEALHIMNLRPCQVLLTDWQMPNMDGLALCRTVRADQRESYVYVLMLTVRNDKKDLLEAVRDRSAHGDQQPEVPDEASTAGAAALAPPWSSARGAQLRHRRLQANQRSLRTRGRRSTLQGFVTRTRACLRSSSDWLARVGGGAGDRE
jgi:CheY-like chemotaxis protein